MATIGHLAAGRAAGAEPQPNGLAETLHGAPEPTANDDDLLVTLRSAMADLAAVSEKRAARAAARTQAAMAANPWLTVAGAVTVGAIVAIAATRNRAHASRSVSVAGYNVPVPTFTVPSLPNVTAGSAITTLGGYAERMIDAISRTDPKALSSERVGEAMDGVRGLLSSVRDLLPRR